MQIQNAVIEKLDGFINHQLKVVELDLELFYLILIFIQQHRECPKEKLESLDLLRLYLEFERFYRIQLH